MGRHILDHASSGEDGAALPRFTEEERKKGVKGPHPATKTLQQRKREESSESARVQEYVRIERGQKE